MEAKLKILIVEDDPIIAEDLAAYMEEFGYEALPTQENADDALKAVRMYDPDLCLLDVHLGSEINGIQLAQLIKVKSDVPIIFLTAFNDRETIEQIKKIEPAAYLVKPVDERSLQTSIEIAFSNHYHAQKEFEEVRSADSIFIKIKDRLVKFKFEDILYFEAYDNYAFLHTEKGKHILSSSLKQLEEKLSGGSFVRTHRSYLVNIHRIDGIFTNYLKMGKTEIPIGKTYRDELLKHIDTL